MTANYTVPLASLLCMAASLLLSLGVPVALVVCLTLLATVLVSQMLASAMPIAARKVGFDPAVMASPLVTTIVDTTTLLIYFNIATAVLRL